MTETAEPTARPIETELKYRVADLRRGRAVPDGRRPSARSAATPRPRSTQMEDRYVDTADGAFRRAGLRGPPPDHRHRHDRLGEVARQARRRRAAPCGARRSKAPPTGRSGAFEWPAVRRPLAGARAGRRRAAGRGRHRPPDAPPAAAARPRDARRAEPRRRRCRGPRPGRRAVRRARGRAAPGERGAPRGPRGSRSTAIRRWRDRPAASSRPRSPRSRGRRRAVADRRGRRPNRAEADEPDDAAPAEARRRRAGRRSRRRGAAPERRDADAPADDDAGRRRPPSPSPGPAPTRWPRSRPRSRATSGTLDDEDPLDDPDRRRGQPRRRPGRPSTDADAAEAEAIGEAAAVVDGAEAAPPPIRSSSSARRPASPPRTTSPRPAARSCASTSPGCSPASPAPGLGVDLEELHGMRVATRRQRAAWRVFGDSFRRKRTKRYRDGLREIAARLGRRPRPRRPARGGRPLPRGPAGHRAARPRAAPRGLARPPRRRARAADPRARLRGLPALGRGLPRVRADRRRRGPAGRPGRGAPRPRHRAVGDLGRLPAGARLRAGPPLGRHRDPPRAADRRQVAALQPRVRPRGARPGVGAAHRPGDRAAGPPRA